MTKKQLEFEEWQRIRSLKIKHIQKQLIQYCSKNRLDFMAARDLIYSTNSYTEENYKSEHILPYKVYASIKKFLDDTDDVQGS